MPELQVEPVDERDSSWEHHAPRFRVYLHDRTDPVCAGWSTSTCDLTGTDVLGAIDWAQRQAGDTLVYAIALVHDDAAREQLDPGRGRGLVWLVGMDANDNPWDEDERLTLERMMLRRDQPVQLSAADRQSQTSADMGTEAER